MTLARCRCHLAAAFAAALVAATPGFAATSFGGEIDDEVRYADCLAMVMEDAEAAYDAATAWYTGGAPARHCEALALVALGRTAEGARRLEDVAAELPVESSVARAQALGQAALAWLQAGDGKQAFNLLGDAIAIDPGNPDLYVDRAQVLATADAYWESIDDLSLALEIAPERADIFTFRAIAYRYVDSLELAADDIERALALTPDDHVALLERGNIRRLSGDDAGARADWLRVVIEAPDTRAATAAQTNLERMDVKIE